MTRNGKIGKSIKWDLCLAREHLLLLVIHTTREEADSEVIRIISARKAEAHERKYYEQHH